MQQENKINVNHKSLKKKFVTDMSINIFATAIPMILLYIVIYPLIADKIDASVFGTLVTTLGIINFINGIWGSSIAFTKLLNSKKISSNGNFTLIFLINLFFALIMLFIIVFLTGVYSSGANIILIMISTVFLIVNTYLMVEYRLKLSYKKILITNVFRSVGFIIGYLCLFIIGFEEWEWIFIMGYGFSMIFNLVSTSIWRHSPKKDTDFNELYKGNLILIGSSSVSGASTYLDKLVIYPSLGSESMAYYQTISNVMLSYLIKVDKLTKKFFSIFVISLIVVSVLGYFLSNLLVPYIIMFLYPKYYDKSVNLIPLTNLIAMLQMIYTFIFPVALRYAKRKMQFIIQIGRLVPYLILVYILLNRFELKGFAYATIISQLIQIIIVLVISYKTMNKKGVENYEE
jgi:O-antigen/teichoic acid export membrane protein